MQHKFLSKLSLLLLLASPSFANFNNIPAPDADIHTDFISLHLHGVDTAALDINHPNDDYRQLERLAQDKDMFTQTFGELTGTAMSWLSAQTLATAFIEESQAADCWHWLIQSPETKITIGMVGINQFKDIEDFQDARYRNKRVFKLGGLLDSQFRGKGILSRATRSILPLLEDLNNKHKLNIEALIIETRTTNARINALAHKLKFKFVGTYWKVIKLNMGLMNFPIGIVHMNQYMRNMPLVHTAN